MPGSSSNLGNLLSGENPFKHRNTEMPVNKAPIDYLIRNKTEMVRNKTYYVNAINGIR